MEELWKTIEDYSDFEVSSLARIRRISTGKILKQLIGKTGYYQVVVSLGQRGKVKLFKIHREVGKLFVPNPDNKPVINHLDGDKLNNLPCNLEWATYSENSRHAFDTGLHKAPSGIEHCNSFLSAEDIEYIRKNYIPKHKVFGARSLARKFNIGHPRILDIVKFNTYKS